MAVFSSLIAGLGAATAATATAGGAAAGAAAATTGGALAAGGGLSTIAGIAGVGAQIYGTMAAQSAAEEQAAIQKQMIKTEAEGAKIEAARARRQIVRETLRAQAMSEVAAGNGGAIMGSGVAGGIAQAANTGGQNTLGVNQNLGMAMNMADLKQQQANAGTAMNRAEMISGIGSGLVGLQSTFARMQPQATRVAQTAGAGNLGWLYGSA